MKPGPGQWRPVAVQPGLFVVPHRLDPVHIDFVHARFGQSWQRQRRRQRHPNHRPEPEHLQLM